MLTTLHCIVIALGQFPDPEPQALPWVLIHKNGDRIVGYVDDDWQEEQMVQVEIDEPWKDRGSDLKKVGQAISRLKSNESFRETSHDWRKRHLGEWKAAGYINVGTEDDMFFVSDEEFELASRATAMVEASATMDSGNEKAPSLPPQALDSTAAEDTPSSFIRAWGLHILVLVVAGGLAGLVVFTLLSK